MALKKVGEPVKKKTPLKKVEKVVEIEREEPQYKDLREVMDYTRDFTMFYSGVETDAYLRGCYDMGVRNFLMSFHYIKEKHLGDITKNYPGIHLFIDSGAHTYQNDPKYADVGVEFWEKHLQSYLRWAERNKDSIFAIASFDYENLVGAQVVADWNQKYIEPFMLRTGIPVCFVWHQTSLYDWEHYCQRYPYVGLSSVNTEGVELGLGEFKEHLAIAEKYNSIVHGFGMTKTGLLPELPYYTVDSTTWKVGFRYGKLIIWNGKTVQQIDKNDWETKAFKYIDQLKGFSYDKQKLYEYYEPEVLRVCVRGFQEAENFIQERLKPLTYWKKAKANVVDLNNLPADFFPEDDWFDTNMQDEDIRAYARKFNINPDKDTQFLMNHIVVLCYLFNEDRIKDYPCLEMSFHNIKGTQVINSIHTKYVNRIVGSDEEKAKDVKKFYEDTLTGQDTRLLHVGTSFDRMLKERETYITDEEYDTVDVSEMDMNNIMSKYLPLRKEGEVAPEISELDDEIFAQEGITAVRDENGRFLKGQRQVLKPKKLVSDKFPKMSCDRCFSAQKCPQYKAGYVCAFNEMFSRYQSRDMGDIIQAMQGITDFSMFRLQRGMLQEMMGGGLPDQTVTAMMQQSMTYLNLMKKMYDNASPEVLRQTKVVRADGTQETTTEVSNPQRGGILEQIFGNMGAAEPKDREEDDIILDAAEVKDTSINEA